MDAAVFELGWLRRRARSGGRNRPAGEAHRDPLRRQLQPAEFALDQLVFVALALRQAQDTGIWPFCDIAVEDDPALPTDRVFLRCCG